MGAKFIKIHGEAEQEKATPDYIGCYLGYFCCIEFKRPGEKATLEQEQRLEEWRTFGAIAFWSDDPHEAAKRVATEVMAKIDRVY